MEPFKYAITDIGANSVRMNIYDVDPETGKFAVIDSVRNMLGLAAYVKDGAVTPDGAGKLSAIIRDYLARANSYPCDKFSAFATASLRGLTNADEVVASIKERFGVSIEIISGIEEATYDFNAIRSRFGENVYSEGIVIDMGGGSTELIMFEGTRSVKLASLPIGCVMLGRRFIPDIKSSLFPTKAQTADIVKYIRDILSENEDFRGKGKNIYLIGGTAKAMAKLYIYMKGDDVKSIDGYSLPASAAKEVRDFVISDAENGSVVLRKVLLDRLLSIVPGTIAYCEIFDFLGAENITVSASGVREGYLLSFIEKHFSRTARET